MRMDGPRLCSAPLRAAPRPGHESGEWRARSPPSLQCASAHPSGSAVEWAKAHSAVPTISLHKQQGVGTLPLCPPYEIEIVARSSARRHASSASRRISPELCFISPPSNPRGRREGRVLARTRGPLREKHTQKEPHSSIQVVPITRPSLRGGWTAYAVISREPTIPSGLPRPANWMMQSARLGSLAPSQGLDRGNDDQDHTVLPYARPAISPQFFLALSTKPETYRRDEA
ncbi:hypothetical protein ABIF83_002888 [Bradyrhizobium ottawaense]